MYGEPLNQLSISSHQPGLWRNGLDSQLSELRARRKAITAHVCDAVIFKRREHQQTLNFSSAADPLYVSVL